MKRVLALTMLSAALSLVTALAHAGVLLSATGSPSASVDFGANTSIPLAAFFDGNDVETIWPFCDTSPVLPGIAPCSKRTVTLGPGRIEDVDIIVPLSGASFPSEIYLNLWHGGTGVNLLHVNSLHGFAPDGSPWIMTFDDEASISLPAPAVTSTVRPLGPLAAFDGQDAAGDWVLTIADYSSSDTHRFGFFTLLLTVPEPATAPLLAIALAGLGLACRRKR